LASKLIDHVCLAKAHLADQAITAEQRTSRLGSSVVLVDGGWAYCRAAATVGHEWKVLDQGITVVDAARYVERAEDRAGR